MPDECPSTLRRLLAATALVVGASLVATVGPGATTVAPAGAAALRRQEEPVPSTEPVTTVGADGSTTTAPADGGTDDGTAEAQQEADEDLRAVWVIVVGLGAVAVGLLVLLILYVRATNPRRAAERRERLLARQDERDAARAAKGKRPRRRDRLDDVDDEDLDDDAVTPRPAPAAAVAAAAAPAPSAEDADETAPPRPAAATVAAAAAPILSRDPDPISDGSEVVRVVGDATPTEPRRPGPVLPEGAGTPSRPAPARPAAARPASVGPAPQLAPDPPATDETVRIIGPVAPSPRIAPAPPPAAASIAPSAPPPAPDDRPPPRSLVETPPPAPPKRPRRVDAPAKKLATPDAERVLVRPGQAPVRVPPATPREGDAPSAADAPAASDAGDGEASGDGDAR